MLCKPLFLWFQLSSLRSFISFPVAGLLDISIPGETTAALTAETLPTSTSAAADLEGLVVNSSAVTQPADDANSSQQQLQQEQLSSSSPGRSPHAAKAGWTVSGF